MNYIKTLIFLVTVPGTVLVTLPAWIGRNSPKCTPRHKAGAVFAVLVWSGGAFMLLWPMWSFITAGRGSPSPAAPPEKLVVEGPYRFVRNPMYLAASMILLGHWLWSMSSRLVAYSAAVITAFHLFIVYYEEPELERRFGEAYRRYRTRVPRWLPKFEAYSHDDKP